ncbi:MAG: AMP-binding protein, partial [Alphaproteobacteria bacterium]
MEYLTQSYVHGTSGVPLLGKTIGQQFDETVARHADRDALVVCHQNVRWSYREMKREVDSLAAGLLTLGLEPGDRIGIWSPNNSEWAVSQFASAKAGLILVNINPAYRLSELEYALNKVECKALISAESFKSSRYLDMIRELAPEIEQCVPGALE